jgi:hypothetical protein
MKSMELKNSIFIEEYLIPVRKYEVVVESLEFTKKNFDLKMGRSPEIDIRMRDELKLPGTVEKNFGSEGNVLHN